MANAFSCQTFLNKILGVDSDWGQVPILWVKVSQPRSHWPFEKDNSMLWGIVQGIADG